MKENGVKKGDVIYVEQEGDRLLVCPAGDKKQEQKRISIDVTEMTKQEIRMQLIAKYMQNFNEITLTAGNMSIKAKDIRGIVHDLMALEVIDEDSSKIVTKDFLNMEDISPMSLINKMDLITREMLSDSKNPSKDENRNTISERDSDVNRLSYLLFRTMRHLEENPAAAIKKGIPHNKLVLMWIAALNIEHIADQAKRIARLIKWVKLPPRENTEFLSIYSAVEKFYVDSMDVFYNNDLKGAFKLVAQQKRLMKQCRDFDRQNWNHEFISVVLENMKTILGETKSLLTHVCDMS